MGTVGIGLTFLAFAASPIIILGILHDAKGKKGKKGSGGGAVHGAWERPPAVERHHMAHPGKGPRRSQGEDAKDRAAANGHHADLVRTMEDRKDDWLARQMREEARAWAMSDMALLKLEHARDCDAEEARRASRDGRG